MSEDELTEFIKENLEIVVLSDDNFRPNDMRVGLKLRDDDELFTWEYLPSPDE